MSSPFRDRIKKRLFKKIGVVACLIDSPMEMTMIWKRPKHHTFPYNPLAHNYKEKQETLSTPQLIRTKGPAELRLAVKKIDLTFSKHEKISSTLNTNYQTVQF